MDLERWEVHRTGGGYTGPVGSAGVGSGPVGGTPGWGGTVGGTQPGRLILSFYCVGGTRPAYRPVEQEEQEQEQEQEQQGKNQQLRQQRPFLPPHSDLNLRPVFSHSIATTASRWLMMIPGSS